VTRTETFSSFNVSSFTLTILNTEVISPNTLFLALGLPPVFVPTPGIKSPDNVVDDNELADNPKASASSVRIDQRGLPVALLGDSFFLSTLAFSLSSSGTFTSISVEEDI
jgi:hypothetical protein